MEWRVCVGISHPSCGFRGGGCRYCFPSVHPKGSPTTQPIETLMPGDEVIIRYWTLEPEPEPVESPISTHFAALVSTSHSMLWMPPGGESFPAYYMNVFFGKLQIDDKNCFPKPGLFSSVEWSVASSSPVSDGGVSMGVFSLHMKTFTTPPSEEFTAYPEKWDGANWVPCPVMDVIGDGTTNFHEPTGPISVGPQYPPPSFPYATEQMMRPPARLGNHAVLPPRSMDRALTKLQWENWTGNGLHILFYNQGAPSRLRIVRAKTSWVWKVRL